MTIDLGGQAVLRGGKEVRLSPTEYGLISALAANAGLVMNHRTLLRSVWGRGYGDERHYLRTYIQRLRAKLEADPKHPEVIVTVGWRGYRLGRPAVVLRPEVDWSARLFDFNRIRDLNEEEVSRSAEKAQAATSQRSDGPDPRPQFESLLDVVGVVNSRKSSQVEVKGS